MITKKSGLNRSTAPFDRSPRRLAWLFVPVVMLAQPARAHASIFQGETLDAIANAISWVVIIIAPIIGITIFWFVHIWPEKIAERKKHPQTKAIQCLCLLSLVFGGLLWPLAWLWAFTKPVGYKLAYGTDVDETVGHGEGEDAPTIAQKRKGQLSGKGKDNDTKAQEGGEA